MKHRMFASLILFYGLFFVYFLPSMHISTCKSVVPYFSLCMIMQEQIATPFAFLGDGLTLFKNKTQKLEKIGE